MRALLALLLLLLPICTSVSAQDLRPIALGQTIEYSFDDKTPKRDEIPYQRWVFSAKANQQVTIEMTSDQFDGYLRLLDIAERLLATDDNGGIGYNARIVIKLPADGKYYIETAALWRNRRGTFRVSVLPMETPLKTGNDKLLADLEYYERCLRATTDPNWASELHSGRLLPLLLLQRDEDALTAADIAVNLAKQTGDQYALAKSYFAIATGFTRFEEYQRALPYFEQTVAIQREIGARPEEATTLRALGDTYQYLDQPAKAREAYQQALELRRKLKDRSGEGFALFGLAESYRLLKQPDQALPFYQQSLECSRETKNRAGESYTLFGMADCYRALDKFEQALPLYQQAMQLSRDLKDRPLEAVTLAALADGYRFLNQCDKALPFYEQTLTLRRELKDRRGEAYTLNGLAQCEVKQNLAARAAPHFEQMLAICRENKDRRGEALALTGLANAYRLQSQLPPAVATYEQALVVLRELKDRKGEYNALIGIAGAHRALGNNDRALPYLEQALAMNIENPDRGSLEQLLTILAQAAAAANQVSQAINYGERLRAIKQQNKDQAGEANIVLLLAAAARNGGDFTRAQNSFQEAQKLFKELNDPIGEYSSYYGLAEVARSQKDLAKIQTNFEAALKIIDDKSIKSLDKNAEASISRVEPAAVYSSYIEALAVLQQFDLALVVAERAAVYNYRLLTFNSKQPAIDGAELAKRLPAASLNEIKQLAMRLLSTIIVYQPTTNGLVVWALRPDGSIFGNYREIKPARLDEILAQRRAMLEVKSIRGDNLRAVVGDLNLENGPAAASTKANNPSTNSLATNNLAGAVVEEDLFGLLFPETIAAVLPAENEARLIIVAAGRIGAQPFVDLRDREGRVFIDRFIISQAPSLSALIAARARRGSEPPMGTLLMGKPAAAQFNGRPLPMLDEIKEELKLVSDQLKSKPFIEAAATRAVFREQAVGKQLVHLATYGYFNDREPLAGFIAFSPELNAQGEVVADGILSMAELQRLNLNIDTLIITATQAGFNPTNGDGLNAFATTILMSSCLSSITTEWNVDGKVVALFLKNFYEQRKKSNDIAGSYRYAMIKTREKYKNPAQWAAFTLIGEPLQQ